MPEGREPTVIEQTMMMFGANFSGYVVAIITGIVVARELGPGGKGIVAYAALLLSLFTTFGAGVQQAILHQCGRGTSQAAAFGAAMRLLGIAMLLSGAVLLLFGVRFPDHAALGYIAVSVPFALYCQTANAVFLINNDVRTPAVQSLIMTVGVAIVTIPALTVFHGGLNAALTAWTSMFIVATAFTVVRLRRYVPATSFASAPGLLRDEAVFGLKAGCANLAAFLNLRVDLFVVGMLLDVRSLGIYSLAVASGEMMWQVSRPLTWTTVGRIAAADRCRAIELTNAVTRNVLAVELLIGAAVFVFAPLAVHLVYGPAYAQSAELVRWLVPGLIIYATSGPLSYFLSVKDGQPTKPLLVQVCSVALCAAISVLTIPRLGLFGAALATTVTYCAAIFALGTFYSLQSGSPVAFFTLLQPVDLRRFGRLIAAGLAAAPAALVE